jgi:hypothetical protein
MGKGVFLIGFSPKNEAETRSLARSGDSAHAIHMYAYRTSE